MKNSKMISGIIGLMLLQINLIAQTNSTMIEKNKHIANQFYSEVINKGDTALLNSIMAENFIDHNAAPDLPKGMEGFKQFLTMVGTAFPDIQIKVQEMLTDGDKVVVRLTVSGTQTGVLMRTIPPSGKHAVWTGIDILKIEKEKITDRWS